MAEFKTIHTRNGLIAMAQAEATGTPINLTHMAVGDGNGNPTTPDESQTNLTRELFRATVNRVYQDPVTPTKFTAELVIPATAGGFVLREVGVFDASGVLFVVGNLPDTYKPMASEGAYADTVVRVEFLVTNVSVVTLQIDPYVAVATQQWITNNVTAGALFPGGTTFQILRKKSNADGDTEWADPTSANVVVDVVEERQTLVTDQTIVTLAVVTTRGLAVYIEGVRLPNSAGIGGWLPDPTDPDEKIILGKSYNAGTSILLVQNEPAGSVPYPLVRDLNLSDVPDKFAARQNLDIFSTAETRQMAPAGMVGYFARNTAPAGWLKANGASVSRTAYADLFAAIGTTFGAGDGFNTFNLPDLRDRVPIGAGNLYDVGAVGGSKDAIVVSHTHTLTGTTGDGGVHNHSINDPGHSHYVSSGAAVPSSIRYETSGAAYGGGQNTSFSGTGISINGAGNHTHSVSGTTSSAGSSGINANLPPYAGLLGCIKF